MSIKSKDIKLLWGRSGNRCAVCKIQLTQDAESVTSAFTLGEQAHIVGEKADAPRGDSPLTQEQRDSYHNLILLCPTHHTEIDKNEADWPVERLHLQKSSHELWVTETLSETVDHVKLAQQVALSAIIDSAVEKLALEKWQGWTSFALSPNQRWPKALPDQIWEFRQQTIAAIWPPAYEELSRASRTLAILAHRAAQEFMEHSEERGEFYFAHRFYRRDTHYEDYDKRVDEFDSWQEECYRLLKDSTRAANWFAEVVRRDINPMFFAAKGKFLTTEGPFADMSFRTSLLEFTDEQKNALPDSLQDAA